MNKPTMAEIKKVKKLISKFYGIRKTNKLTEAEKVRKEGRF